MLKFLFLVLTAFFCLGPQYALAETAQKLITWPHKISIAYDRDYKDYKIFSHNLKKLIETGTELDVSLQHSNSNSATLLQVDSATATLGILPVTEIWKGSVGYNPILWGYKFTHVRSLYPIFETPIALLSLEDLHIRHVGMLEGKTVGLLTSMPLSVEDQQALLDSLGLNISYQSSSLQDAISALKTGDISAILLSGHQPQKLVEALETTKNLHFLHFSREQRLRLEENNPYLTPYTIQANRYLTDKEEIKTFSVRHFLITNHNLPMSLAAHISDLSVRYRSFLEHNHPSLRVPLTELDTPLGFLPLHKGYETYLTSLQAVKKTTH